jgi:hypothetical protein
MRGDQSSDEDSAASDICSDNNRYRVYLLFLSCAFIYRLFRLFNKNERSKGYETCKAQKKSVLFTKKSEKVFEEKIQEKNVRL